jgi:hypothetical protein
MNDGDTEAILKGQYATYTQYSQQQDRQCTYNVKLKLVCATIIAVKKQ